MPDELSDELSVLDNLTDNKLMPALRLSPGTLEELLEGLGIAVEVELVSSERLKEIEAENQDKPGVVIRRYQGSRLAAKLALAELLPEEDQAQAEGQAQAEWEGAKLAVVTLAHDKTLFDMENPLAMIISSLDLLATQLQDKGESKTAGQVMEIQSETEAVRQGLVRLIKTAKSYQKKSRAGRRTCVNTEISWLNK